MLQNNNVKCVSNLVIPSPLNAVQMYTSNGGQLTVQSSFGVDPLSNNFHKQTIRQQSFGERCPSFDTIFGSIINGNTDMFKDNLLLFIDITTRLALT